LSCRIDLTKQSYFSVPGPHHALFLCLTYLAHCPDMSSWDDCRDALRAYEQALHRYVKLKPQVSGLSTPVVHALYILAQSRLAAQDNAALQYTLLAEFSTRYADTLERRVVDGGWITAREWELLHAVPKSNVTPVEDAHKALQRRWKTVVSALDKVGAGLKGRSAFPNFTAARGRLMEMEGQLSLKEAVVEMHEELLQHLQRNGASFAARRFVTNRMFVLVGASGTGKTTAARLFASTLGELSLPEDHKVVQYTAKEALRAGPKHFAVEVATLTGGGEQRTAPPTTSEKYFRKGTHVEVRHWGKWYAGQVTKSDRTANTYSVKYADGTEDENLNFDRMRGVTFDDTAGGVLVVDDAHQLDPASSDGGALS
jgi:hypothetical protein